MTEDQIIRKIAVIFVTDVVSFSTLMEKNENSTLRSLRACRDIMNQLFKKYDARIFNTAGDSVLAEFQSAVAAVVCATEFQNMISKRNLSVSEDLQMQFRIGLNVGDVIVEGTNLYGEGVNNAARLEVLSQPGGVSLSKAIYDFANKKVEFKFTDLGTQKIKNTVLHAYDVIIEGLEPRASGSSIDSSEITESKPPTIAVMPFKNMSNDEEQEYFVDGVTEDIIANLSSWKSFPVIARNSTFSFKGQAIKPSELGQRLGADYIVEGSIRKGGNKIRISASLVDAKDDQQVWSKRWDRSLDDIFEVQDEVSQEVATLIFPALKGKEHERIRTKSPSSLSAWDNYLKALAIYNQTWAGDDPDEAANKIFFDLCDAAIAKDPDLCDAYVLKARRIYGNLFMSVHQHQRIENELLFHDLSFKAYSIDPNNPEAVAMYSRSFNLKKDYPQRLKYARQALDLNPSHDGSNNDYGWALCNDKRFEEAEYYLLRAMEMNPIGRKGYEGLMPFLYMAMADSNKSLEWCNILYDRGSHSRYNGWRAAIYVHLGDIENARIFLTKFRKERPEVKTIEDYKKVAPSICKDYLIAGLSPIWED
ncbi:MAG: adenylate/guanylate cyclase domain-containing protein [Paracoccaceae bacterium]|jgi:adenylate cyclase|nr:adenylate/guanylate cyclase domain-containing protein [Paracoccaceae bacterium]